MAKTARSLRLGEHDESEELACRHLAVIVALNRLVGSNRQTRKLRQDVWAAAFGRSLESGLTLARLIRSTPVLIVGETGTGKELIAQSVGKGAPGTWKDGRWTPAPFDAVNLAALPPTLVHSALFGHKRGAFSGAHAAHHGVLVRCHGGVVFLDEVADLDPQAQVALLRALQEGRARPLGAEKDEPAEARVISATHRCLRTLIANGTDRLRSPQPPRARPQ